MFVISNLLLGLAKVLDIGLSVYMWIIIVRALLSWVNPDPYNQIVRLLYSLTEPVLAPIRRRVPMLAGGMDFSPLIVILAIVFLKSFLVRSMMELAFRMS
jgi:YggT family protein